eukprot:TRINITY_DN5145_c0_g2_i1.p1 TRINITY_DN5145_c0_g2~~TRINITY_DN5145_c0_g2_i1.p1  ORF type:complete len:321 (+),score=106.06 TRINITY_DN5145_c0_g2_i1:75-965(+)
MSAQRWGGPESPASPATAAAWVRFAASARGELSEAELACVSEETLQRLMTRYGTHDAVERARCEVVWKALRSGVAPEAQQSPGRAAYPGGYSGGTFPLRPTAAAGLSPARGGYGTPAPVCTTCGSPRRDVASPTTRLSPPHGQPLPPPPPVDSSAGWLQGWTEGWRRLGPQFDALGLVVSPRALNRVAQDQLRHQRPPPPRGWVLDSEKWIEVQGDDGKLFWLNRQTMERSYERPPGLPEEKKPQPAPASPAASPKEGDKDKEKDKDKDKDKDKGKDKDKDKDKDKKDTKGKKDKK